jgi:hypothetical protein
LLEAEREREEAARRSEQLKALELAAQRAAEEAARFLPARRRNSCSSLHPCEAGGPRVCQTC